MKVLQFMILILFASPSYSDQGLVLKFAIERSDDSTISNRYENAVLISFGDVHSFKMPNQYELNVFAEETSANSANVRFEYSDVRMGAPQYIDTYESNLVLNEPVSVTQSAKSGENKYQLTLWVSYGELP